MYDWYTDEVRDEMLRSIKADRDGQPEQWGVRCGEPITQETRDLEARGLIEIIWLPADFVD